jgi:hypothetical protein
MGSARGGGLAYVMDREPTHVARSRSLSSFSWKWIKS